MSVHGDVVSRAGCPDCGSRDNVAVYDDGYKKCFGQGCGYWEGTTNGTQADGLLGKPSGSLRDDPRRVPMVDVEYVALNKRGISEETCRLYKYGVGEKFDGTPVHVAQYGNAQKFRTADKQFSWINRESGTPLFGRQLWKPQKRLVITEGELDCLSYAEAVDCKWPVVSVPDGAGSAVRAVNEAMDWISQFEEVVIMFDMDEPGQAAAQAVAEILPPGKAMMATLPRKDPNETLLECGAGELVRAAFQAKPFHPAGIVEGLDLLEKVLEKPEYGLSYPWPCLDTLTYGQREGTLTTWIAGTGVGKSQVLREVAYHLAMTHGEKVGVIALEESNKSSALGLLSLDVGVPLHLAEGRESVTNEVIETAANKVLPNFAFYDHFGSVDAEVLIPKIRHMRRSMGIKWIILDHISIMVSGSAAEGDERKRIDELATNLRTLCSELGIGLHIVSHLRKASGTPHEEGGAVSLQDIRGSGAPAQLSDLVIGLERNQQAATEAERNTTTIRVLKNRHSGETGVAGALRYVANTCRMIETEIVDVDFGGHDTIAQGREDF